MCLQAPSSRQFKAAPLSGCPGRSSVRCVFSNKPGTSTHSIQLVVPSSYRSRLANPDGTGSLPLSLMLALVLVLSETEHLCHSQYSFVSPLLVSGGGVGRQEGGATTMRCGIGKRILDKAEVNDEECFRPQRVYNDWGGDVLEGEEVVAGLRLEARQLYV